MKKRILFYTTLFLVILAYSITAPNYDFDLWARLIAGMGAVDGGHVLKADFLSYTPVHTWWDHEWASGAVFYLFLKFFGPYSLVILQAVLIWGIFFIVSKITELRTGIPRYNILFYFFAFYVLIANFNHPVRCHLFTFLFFTLFIYILELSRKGNTKPLLAVPFIIIIWNNLHGGVVAGFGLMLIYILAELLDRKPVKKYLITFAVSCLVMLINPWGFDYIKFLLTANTMERADVAEWWGLFSKRQMFRQIPFKLFMLFSLALEGIAVFKLKNHDKAKYMVLIITLCLAVAHVKLLPFFVIAVCCYCCEDFYALTKHWNFPRWKDTAVYAILLFCALFSVLAKDLTPPLNFNAYPVKEVEFIKINEIKGNLLVNFGLGSYASYKLYPDNLIYMDGRYEEVYYDYMIPLLKKFYLVNPGWDEVLDKFTPDVMIIEQYYPVYGILKESPKWDLVYEGKVFGVFLPAGKVRKTYKLPSDDIGYYKNSLFDTAIKF
ncbi:MAG: hypothetical protein LBK53_00610 [Heliobacteriaceae bacterium]|jgi:hypothetical protein|nr:hypothetical protein [Heliobacteriaceae bacterium]